MLTLLAAAEVLLISRLADCLHFSVTRVSPAGGGDIFLQNNIDPSRCLSASFCAQFGGLPTSPSACQCQCGWVATPLFRQDRGECADGQVDCQQLHFLSPTDANLWQRRIPTFPRLPGPNELLSQAIDWSGADWSGGESCRVEMAEWLTEGGWKAFPPGTLGLAKFDGQTHLQWLAEEWRDGLSGKFLRVKMFCRRNGTASGRPQPVCVAFRFAGVDAELRTEVQRSRAEDQSEIGLAAGVTVGSLLLLSIFLVLTVWLVWTRRRGRRRKVAAERQWRQVRLQQLQTLELGVSNHFCPPTYQPALLAGTFASAPGCRSPPLSTRHWAEEKFAPAAFHPDPFDPQMSSEAAAEEFLAELRQMIEAAKTRLRRRRFVPALEAIAEELSEAGRTAKSSQSDSTGDSGVVDAIQSSPTLPGGKVAEWLLASAPPSVEPPKDYDTPEGLADVIPPCRRLGHFGSLPHRRHSRSPTRANLTASLPRRPGNFSRPTLSPATFAFVQTGAQLDHFTF